MTAGYLAEATPVSELWRSTLGGELGNHGHNDRQLWLKSICLTQLDVDSFAAVDQPFDPGIHKMDLGDPEYPRGSFGILGDSGGSLGILVDPWGSWGILGVLGDPVGSLHIFFFLIFLWYLCFDLHTLRESVQCLLYAKIFKGCCF